MNLENYQKKRFARSTSINYFSLRTIAGSLSVTILAIRTYATSYDPSLYNCGERILIAYLVRSSFLKLKIDNLLQNNLFPLCTIFRCYRLYFIFHFTKQRLRYQFEADGDVSKDRTVWHKIISNKKILSDKYNAIAFALVALFFFIFPAIGFISASVRTTNVKSFLISNEGFVPRRLGTFL